jgi:hypothetical protein
MQRELISFIYGVRGIRLSAIIVGVRARLPERKRYFAAATQDKEDNSGN